MKTKERPILFSAPMVRAILEGRKTQTRRAMKPQPAPWAQGLATPRFCSTPLSSFIESAPIFVPNRYGKPGDRLWVRETHYLVRAQGKPDGQVIEIDYKADPDHTIRMCPQKWRPSIHMPRWASRILLEIVSVRVERLQDITRGDCMSEGCPFPNLNMASAKTDPIAWFSNLWQSINGAGSWQANPWVWVIEFKRVDQ